MYYLQTINLDVNMSLNTHISCVRLKKAEVNWSLWEMSRNTYGRKKVMTGRKKNRTKQTHIYLDNWYFTQTTLFYHLTLISVRVKYIEIFSVLCFYHLLARAQVAVTLPTKLSALYLLTKLLNSMHEFMEWQQIVSSYTKFSRSSGSIHILYQCLRTFCFKCAK